jgi:hypothetical protein
MGVYMTCFSLLTYPAMLKFHTHYFHDNWDGLQQVWNIWWVNKAVTDLHQLPWNTDYLFYPSGMTLLGHAFGPVNGFIGIAFLPIMGLLQTFNLIFVMGFVLSGLTCFFLSYYLSRSYWGSIVAGFIFTFSSYHFAHAGGHLHLVSMQWIPVFLLCWFLLLARPSIVFGLSASGTLFLVLLSSYYYGFFATISGLVFFVGHAFRAKNAFFFLKRSHLVPLSVFVFASLLTTGSLVRAMVASNARDPFTGGHSAREFSQDLLAPFIHGGHWRFSSLTEPYWSSVDLKIDESSVHLGVSVVTLLILGLLLRKRLNFPTMGLWYFLLVLFFLLSLGPVLHVWGKEFPQVVLPYALLEKLLPPLRLSGVPAPMVVVTLLAAAVISAVVLRRLFQLGLLSRGLALLLIAVLVVEYLPSTPHGLPAPIWTSQVPVPEYIRGLKKLPAGGSVFDLTARSDLDLYYQTIHDKPIALGSQARLPASLAGREGELKWLVSQGKFVSLRTHHGVKYLIAPAQLCPGISADCASVKLVYQDGSHWLYDLSP